MTQIVVQGREYAWPDPTTISFREAKLIKDKIGVSVIQTLTNLAEGTVDEDTLLSMFLVAKLRADGDVDVESILDLSFTDIEFLDEPEEPQEAADDRPLDVAKPRSRSSSKSSKSASSASS